MKKLKSSTIKSYTFQQLANHIQNYTESVDCGYRTLRLGPYQLQVLTEAGDAYYFQQNCTNKDDLIELLKEIY